MSDTEEPARTSISTLRHRRGIVKASIKRLTTRLTELETKVHKPTTLSHAHKLAAKLESLDQSLKFITITSWMQFLTTTTSMKTWPRNRRNWISMIQSSLIYRCVSNDSCKHVPPQLNLQLTRLLHAVWQTERQIACHLFSPLQAHRSARRNSFGRAIPGTGFRPQELSDTRRDILISYHLVLPRSRIPSSTPSSWALTNCSST